MFRFCSSLNPFCQIYFQGRKTGQFASFSDRNQRIAYTEIGRFALCVNDLADFRRLTAIGPCPTFPPGASDRDSPGGSSNMNRHVETPKSAKAEVCPIGKVVSIFDGRSFGRVIGRSDDGKYGYKVKLLEESDDMLNLPTCSFQVLTDAPTPTFEEGDYARTSDGVFYIIGRGDDCYQVASTERDEEPFYRADELTPWSPLPGECVMEANNEHGLPGLVVAIDGNGNTQVKWLQFNRLQTWSNADLEPAWEN
jgi:hypothetical protein